MTPQEEREFVTGACQKLEERGWFPGERFKPSTITEEEISAFEREHQVHLPSLYRTFLTSFRLPQDLRNAVQICSILEAEFEELTQFWIEIDRPRSMADVTHRMELLQEIRDFCELPEDCFRNLIPIGDFGAGWGPLCIDLSQPEDKIDEKDESTWSLVWFDHEEFDWDHQYLGEDGLLHGKKALPNLKALLELYFYGVLEERFEREEGIKPTYEWYHENTRYQGT